MGTIAARAFRWQNQTMENEMVFKDDISAMRYGMESALQDLKWTEVVGSKPGWAAYQSPGDEVRFEMSWQGTAFTFGYDDGQGNDPTYEIFAAADTWKEFERALYLAQAIEEEKLGARRDLIGKWWDSLLPTERVLWFNAHNSGRIPAAPTFTAWRALSGHECETIEREVLKGITK